MDILIFFQKRMIFSQKKMILSRQIKTGQAILNFFKIPKMFTNTRFDFIGYSKASDIRKADLSKNHLAHNKRSLKVRQKQHQLYLCI